MVRKVKSADALRRRCQRLSERLGKTGLILQGTITQRKIAREDPYQPGKAKEYGPYFQWTFKEKGKTRTVNLTASQARVYQKAIDNNRKMEEIVQEMRDLSLEFCQATTKGVKKRKSRK